MLDTVLPDGVRDTDHAVIKLAIMAVGGQGGGVLSDWIVDVAERSGFVAQSTSVAGVAQRTGATIYYIEMARDTGRLPVFALSPAQGDVDVLVAAELMEAGRAIMRGFVTPDRTTLIASSHRIAAVSEKVEPGDGRASSPKVREAAASAAKRFIAFDMEKIAVDAGSVISASLLGAVAGSGTLPFARDAYEAAISAGGRGTKQSLAAFAGAYERAVHSASVGNLMPPPPPPAVPLPRKTGEDQGRAGGAVADLPLRNGGGGPPEAVEGASSIQSSASGPARQIAGWQALVARVARLPAPVQDIGSRGLRKVVDFQDLAYGTEYLDRLDKAVALESAANGYALSNAAAKHLANAMCYDDMIRVADLKTRSTRDARLRGEVGVADEAVVKVTEFFHPRIEEFCGTMPAPLGRYIEARPKLAAFLDRRINRGRRIRTDSFAGFAALWFVGGLRRWRRSLLRHQVETEHLERWYALALDHVPADYNLAVEILNCRRLIKGYSDTHVRGQSKFDRVLSALGPLKGRADAADWIRRLREAALKDEAGTMLDGALKTVATLNA
jgi:indolepyruvate ferredoxin oxidoreductase beta subunit